MPEEVILSRVNFCSSCSLEKENAELSNSVTELTNSKTELENKVTELTNSKTELENKVTELEKQIEKMKSENNSCPDVMCEDCNKECELKKIMGETK